ncbi:PREDICTED: short transient receptor potential channel 4-like [Acromyrmex echinatior]|uniref:short transient receptor potential channel 4-like n=1 Tax=Acromyrmex echinatior TaxID=103372 RepID=UPI000580F0C0|nr:PREDICTED: short transient receptor potential channel 4-like [Acromyrmex echinatior]
MTDNETTAGTEEDELGNPGVMFPHLQELEKKFFEIVDDGSVTEARLFLEQHPDFNINAINFQACGCTWIFPGACRKAKISVNIIVTGVGDNNGAGPLLGSASVNAPQMGEKRRRAILPTKRDTTEKKSGADSLLKVDLTTGRDRGKKEFRESPEIFRSFNHYGIPLYGMSALHIAVNDRNMAMVEFLLSHPDIDPGDTHLHAIRDNQVRIAVLILNKLNELTPGLEYAGVTHSPDFPDDTTPLAVAAQYGRFEMIDILRFRRHILPKPHPPSCNCDEVCKPEREKVDIVTLEKMRLFIYSAISNPIYLCQTEEDPILKAFQLSAEFSKEASFDKEFYPDYKALSDEVSQFATELIDCARTAEEVRCILRQITGFGRTSSFEYPRLLLALDYEQKTFVAHPNVQQLVESKWIDTWHEWKVRNTLLKCLTIIPRIVMLPIMAFVMLLAPNSKQAKFYEIPINKCLSSVANYVIFLTFVFLQSRSDKTEQLRGPPNTGYEWVLAIYVISYTIAFIRLCIVDGPVRCFRTRTNWYELVMIILFILTFLFWIVAAIDVRINGQRDLERKYWHKYDPTLIAEGIFCVATIMAFFKLLFICQLHYDLGPLQLSLVKMIRDVGHFVAIFGIIVMAFAIGLCHLYQYYNGMVQTDDESKLKTEQESSFVDLKSTLKTLFWAVFCMSPVESADVIIENLPGGRDSETIINHHTFTEFIGYSAFASFQFISVVIVLNMLIACMANTFTKVTDNVNVEWIFGRTEEDLEEQKDERFAEVMTQLVQRYLRRYEKKMEETDIQKLRNELKEFSNILKEALSPS